MKMQQTKLTFEVGRRRVTAWVLATAVAMMSFASAAQAQDKNDGADKPPTAQSHPMQPMLWDVETMMEQAVQQISKRYSLNSDQENYTRLLLKNRVKSFLDEYEAEVRELLQESIDMRGNPSKADPTALRMWAERATPLYQKASQAILDGNEEWGAILNEDQKKIHDGDLRLMRTSFEGVKRTMKQWSDGKGKLMPTKSTNAAQQASNSSSQPTEGSVSPNPKPVVAQNIEDNWLSYVNMFVSAYNLEAAAKVSAKEKIYKEQFNKARRYRQLRAVNFDRIAKQLKQLPPKEANKRQAVQKRLKRLESPIYDFFVEMDRRLKKLPTAGQAAEVDATRKKQLEQLYAVLSGKNDRAVAKKRSGKPQQRVKKDANKEVTKPKTTDKPSPEATPAKTDDDAEKSAKSDKTDPKTSPETKDGDKKPAKPADEKKTDDERVAA